MFLSPFSKLKIMYGTPCMIPSIFETMQGQKWDCNVLNMILFKCPIKQVSKLFILISGPFRVVWNSRFVAACLRWCKASFWEVSYLLFTENHMFTSYSGPFFAFIWTLWQKWSYQNLPAVECMYFWVSNNKSLFSNTVLFNIQ